MKYLAEGYQYKVYDLGNGRVYKKTQPYWYTFIKTMEVAKKQENKNIFEQIKIAYKSAKINKKALEIIREYIKDMPSYIFANPKFIKNFEQDKVQIVEDFLKTADIEEKKWVLDNYLKLQELFWQYGIHDSVYKFQPNYGIDKEKRVVCIDFGEFMFDKEKIIKSIEKQKWLKRPSYNKWDNNDPFKEYYTIRIAEVINVENFKNNWKAVNKN